MKDDGEIERQKIKIYEVVGKGLGGWCGHNFPRGARMEVVKD